MKINVTDARWRIDSTGAWVAFKTEEAEARAICESIEPGKPYTCDVRRFYKKRSLDANGLLWELCTQISIALAKDKTIVSKEQVYREHIKAAGKCDFVACVDRAAEALMTGWAQRGIGWFAELVDDCKIPGCKKICLYYGSSTYDTAEMSRLLDSVIEEAKQCGVEVMSDSELDLIKREWT